MPYFLAVSFQSSPPADPSPKKTAPLGGSSQLVVVNNHGDRKSPKWDYSPYKWPKWLINGGDPNHFLSGGPSSKRGQTSKAFISSIHWLLPSTLRVSNSFTSPKKKTREFVASAWRQKAPKKSLKKNKKRGNFRKQMKKKTVAVSKICDKYVCAFGVTKKNSWLWISLGLPVTFPPTIMVKTEEQIGM